MTKKIQLTHGEVALVDDEDFEKFNHAAFVRERGPLCQCGECQEPGTDAHHCLIGRMKDHPELDVPENLVLVNHFEHISLRKFSSLEWRIKFFNINCERYGRERMMVWVNSLPTKLKSRIDFV